MAESDFWWMRTVGGPTENDPRNGELHQVHFDGLPEHQDIELPSDEEIDTISDETLDPAEMFADRFWRNPTEPSETHEDGRPIWNYHYVPYGSKPSWS